jgi:chemotaxis protein methyltransferase CheR
LTALEIRQGAPEIDGIATGWPTLSKSQMNDTDCIAFLQWALPRLDLRWSGFRKVRRQVCRRIGRRMADLKLQNLNAYRQRLEVDPAEWQVLDDCCHITISRFFRDRRVFETLRTRVLPDVAAHAAKERREARIWSAGCASGEEPYTLKILWGLEIARRCPCVPLLLVATDVDGRMIDRAHQAHFEATSLRELPSRFVEEAFDRVDDRYSVKSELRQGINFLVQDLRVQTPSGPFDLVLCRYVAFTYFGEPLQRRTLSRILTQLLPGAYLAIGAHERIPDRKVGLTPLHDAPQIWQKTGG